MISVARIQRTAFLTGTNFNAVLGYDLASHYVRRLNVNLSTDITYRNITAAGDILVIEDSDAVVTCTATGGILTDVRGVANVPFKYRQGGFHANVEKSTIYYYDLNGHVVKLNYNTAERTVTNYRV